MGTIKKHLIFSFAFILIQLLSSCQAPIKSEDLYGTWKYIKVEHPNANPPDSLRREDLNYQSPSIRFFQNNNYLINWGGKVLSHGTFTINGKEIFIKETLPDEAFRTFPFEVSELTNQKIVFETRGEDGSRVTAVKQ
jgi:hypothetical protein